MKRVFISDCEGPISKNDNAFEISARFIPNGKKIFTLISKYDDVLADVLKKSEYSAGSTLKLILPFLKAYGVTDRQMELFSAQNLILIASSKDTLQHIKALANAFIVSTSYEHYIKALCKSIDFPFANTYCTRLTIDKYALQEKERKHLKEIAREIGEMQMICIPKDAKNIRDFSPIDQDTIKRLDTIFWNEIESMNFGRVFTEIVTVGGRQKATAIKDAVARLDAPIEDVMYVGDSITDVEALQLVRENAGLTVSFNGNKYAVNNSEIAVLSENNTVTAIIADVFCKKGRQAVLQLVKKWSREAIRRNRSVSLSLIEKLFSICPYTLPKVQIVTYENMELLGKESSEFRKRVRGKSIGRLG